MTTRIDGFVLSTGRTGTVAITNVLNTAHGVKVLHEPSPSRRFHILGMFYRQGRLKKERLANIYFRSRKTTLKNIKEDQYIEVNPFVWGMGEIFCEMIDRPKVLHIVRDIRTYIVSRINFKAKGWHRYVIGLVPFWEVKVNRFIQGIDDWGSLRPEEKASWTWVLINKTIDENENNTPNYLRVRFEDIVSQDEAVQKDTLRKISDLFEIQLDIKASCDLLRKKFNPSTRVSVKSFELFDKDLQGSILNITAPLLRKYGYPLGAVEE